jgi:methyl-accepting chemotaxis protein
MSLTERYERALVGNLERLGLGVLVRSLEAQLLTGATAQLLWTVLAVGVGLTTTGRVQTISFVVVGLLAVVTYSDTLLLVRRRIAQPIQDLERAADTIARGDIDDATVPEFDKEGDIGSLVASFDEMALFLQTVSEQADAVAQQQFDDPVLDEELPGQLGDSLDRMATNLRSYTTELERRTEAFQQLLDTFADGTERAKHGDLTATIDTADLRVDDQYRELIVDYNELVTTLGGTVADLRSFGSHVRSRSETTHRSVVEADEASEDVRATVSEIERGATEQMESLRAAVREIGQLSDSTQSIADSADELAATARRADERGQSGREELEAAVRGLRELRRQSRETVDAIEDLTDQMAEIEEVVTFIQQVSEETDLLALNASVEAAHASGDSEGFAVIAEEVKALAEETRDSADQVAETIAAVTAQTTETADDVRAMNTALDERIENAEAVLGDLDQILETVSELNDRVQEINEATDEQADTARRVTATIEDVAEVSEETAADAEAVAASVDEQTDRLRDASDAMAELTTTANELDDRLARFELPDGDRAVETGHPTGERETVSSD